MDLRATLEKHGNRGAERVAQYVGRHPEALATLLAEMGSQQKRVKNAAAKAIRIISETEPTLLEPQWATFEALLESDDTIVKWIAIDVCGNLARVNSDRPLGATTVRRLTKLLNDESMVTASHAVDTLGKVAEGQSKHRARVTTALAGLEVSTRNPDCRDILLGRVIQAYDRYWMHAGRAQRATMQSVGERQRRNPMAATRKKAERLLRRMS